MAEENESNEDRTEEATPERREEFREKGHVVSSRELTSVVVLAAMVGFITSYGPTIIKQLRDLYVTQFERIASFRVGPDNFIYFCRALAEQVVFLLAPLFLVAAGCAMATTFLQTKFNWSWERIKPDFNRLDPLKGIVRLVSMQAVMELLKGLAKVTAVGLVSYLVLKSEWIKVPSLLQTSVDKTFSYWAGITEDLFWGVAIMLVVVAGVDYAYNFFALEKKLKMTKKEVREDYKKREVDPQVKAKMRRMQRDFASRRMLEKTKEATVIITNPEHFAVALKYELGMLAPIVIAKGMDFLAQRMKETARELDIPIVENKPLARTLYKIVNVGDEIPDSLYKAVSEIIRYVFRLKGISLGRQQQHKQATQVT